MIPGKTSCQKRGQAFFKIALLSLLSMTSKAQNVGIGTTNPLAKLHVADSNVVFSAPGNIPDAAGNVPISGGGRRVLWYPDKAAFRVGYVDGTKWDKDSIGPYSIALGFDNLAKGVLSVAMGYQTSASDFNATAMGRSTTASGFGATAMGIQTVASGSGATAMGFATAASEGFSTAMGYTTTASNYYATAMGAFTRASGYCATAMGAGTLARAFSALAIGAYNDTLDVFSTGSGQSPIDRLFQIGNGNSMSDRKNAITVLRNGNIGIGITEPSTKLHVHDGNVVFSAYGIVPPAAGDVPFTGAGRAMMWYVDKAAFRAGYVQGTKWNKDSIGPYSIALGYDNLAKGDYTVALGYKTTASGYNATAIGWSTIASGFFSTATGFGTRADGDDAFSAGTFTSAYGNSSTAMGDGTIASGRNATAMGFGTEARGNNSISMGQGLLTRANSAITIGILNDSLDFSTSPTVSSPADRLFQIGNGTSALDRRNAMTVLRNGNVGIGTTSPGFPLNFSNASGDKISLWGDNGIHYGFGIQQALMQIYTDGAGADIAFGYGSSGAFTENMRIKGNGNVGIGTAAPTAKLCVNGSIAYTSYLGACSDVRYKKDFVFIPHPLKSILAINGYYYFWRQNEFPEMEFTDKRQIGFSAQEIEKLFPEVVMTNADGYKSVDYSKLLPVVVEAIKEQQKQIEAIKEQQKQLKEQQKQIDELKVLVEKLNNR